MPAEVVIGAAELDKAFQRAGATMQRELDNRLRFYAQPVVADAEALALASGAGPAWSDMRVGASRRLVYVAPVKRGTRIESLKRPKFARRLLSRAMEPALNRNRANIERQFDELLARIERGFHRG